ncbi:uncharacterized protein LTR77_003833 [Saxophila tyrrhenica]|uniref:Uncharacterized protein n=1 Tax=Saxophila tyrrhenica TaxID=1690608 RepID=A0AAV9PFG0_9PEZI|nr:hypothetical protein LTR77_003833 [Saxophila tyrrhenica]
MDYKDQTAFVTGGASGIARALTQRLIDGGARIFIADINLDAAQSFVDEINQQRPDTAFCTKCDVNSWDELTSAFSKAIEIFDRVDYVFPIAGLTERQVIPKPSEQQDVKKHGFVKPDLAVFDTNATGMINLVLIAVQAFRRQEKREELGGMRGKIVCVSSTCGLYAIYGVPIYTASKQAMVGITRTYGVLLPSEGVTLNAICPHVVKTAISKHTPWWYDDLEKRGLLTDIGQIVAGFEEYLGKSTRSAECLECGPEGRRVVEFIDYMGEKTKLGCEAVIERSARTSLWQDQ